jgi:CheY-like chemotaxis protein
MSEMMSVNLSGSVDVSGREPRRLLIVEDDPDIAASMAILLSDERVRIEIASNGLEALQKARELRPHAILMDVMLPRLDGFEVYRMLRSDPEMRSVRVVFVSAHVEPGRFATAAERAEAHAWLRKPFDEATLRTKVFDALHLRDAVPHRATITRLFPDSALAPRIALVTGDRGLLPALDAAAREALPYGGDFTVHASGRAALAAFERAPPHLVLLDFSLADVDGVTVLRMLKATPALAAVPVIMLAAGDVTNMGEVALDAGALAVLPIRPLEPSAAMAALRRALPVAERPAVA